MPDHATNDFLKKYGSQFGDIDFDASGVKTSLSDKGSFKMNHDGVTKDGKALGGDGIDMEKAGGIASDVMGAAPAVMGLIDNMKGGQFDTSAEGGGVGKAGGAIMQGAAQGMEAGKAFGIYGQAIGAVVGGGISTFAHSAAQKEYKDNRNKFNIKENALERTTREDEYRQSEGLAALDSLQNLRKKQLGVTS